MTKPTPHGQVPEALIDLIDAYAETRHRYGRIYNAKTEAARKTVIEALSGVQALSAAPEAIAKLRHLYQNMVNGAVRDTASAKRIAEGLLAPAIEALERATPPAEQQAAPEAAPAGFVPVAAFDRLHAHAESLAARLLAASPTPPAEQAAPKAAQRVGSSGFDYQTAADFLSGKTVSDEAVRKFVAASRWAHDEKAALSAMLLSVRGELASREAEIALLKKALLEAEAAPQQEAQAPVAWLNPWRADKVTTDYDAYGELGIPLYTAPQPAPAPLSEQDPLQGAANWLAQAHGQFCVSVLQGCLMIGHNRAKRLHDAALAAQGGKDA